MIKLFLVLALFLLLVGSGKRRSVYERICTTFGSAVILRPENGGRYDGR